MRTYLGETSRGMCDRLAPVGKKGREKARDVASVGRMADLSDGVCGCDVQDSEETVGLSCCEGPTLQSRPRRAQSRIGGGGGAIAAASAARGLVSWLLAATNAAISSPAVGHSIARSTTP